MIEHITVGKVQVWDRSNNASQLVPVVSGPSQPRPKREEKWDTSDTDITPHKNQRPRVSRRPAMKELVKEQNCSSPLAAATPMLLLSEAFTAGNKAATVVFEGGDRQRQLRGTPLMARQCQPGRGEMQQAGEERKLQSPFLDPPQ